MGAITSEGQPSIYSEEDINLFLEHITDPDERARKKAFLEELGKSGAIMNDLHALEPIPSDRTDAVIDQTIEGIAEIAESITG